MSMKGGLTLKKAEYIESILDRLHLFAIDVDPDAVQKRTQAIEKLPEVLRTLQSGNLFMKVHPYIPFFVDHIEYTAYQGEISDKTYKHTRMTISIALSILIDIAEVNEAQRDTLFAVWKPYFLSRLPVQDRKKVAKS